MGINVLSLFDGCGMAYQALKNVGIEVDNYYASEIDKYAIQIAMKNHPDIKQLGDIRNIRADDLPKIDLLIGGSPCQGFSFAGKQLNFDDPRSKLFFEYVRLLNEVKPKFFLLENVKMKKEYSDEITRIIGSEPILINSSLVSAQQRKRLYWCNFRVNQPLDRGIYLKDILETDIEAEVGRIVGRRINSNGKRDDYNKDIDIKQRLEVRGDGKSGALTTVQKDNVVCDFADRDKSYCIDANYARGDNLKRYFTRGSRQLVFDKPIRVASLNSGGQGDRIYSIEGKSVCLSANGGGRGAKTGLYGDKINYRKLTPIECERLQTLPDNYTEGVSNSQRYKMLGNGFTVAVIEHILDSIKEFK